MADVAQRKRASRPWNADIGVGSENHKISEATEQRRDEIRLFAIYLQFIENPWRRRKTGAGRSRVPKANLSRRGCTYVVSAAKI